MMTGLTKTEKFGLIFLAAGILLGQAVMFWRQKAGTYYQYRLSDWAALSGEAQGKNRQERAGLQARVVRARIDPNKANPEELCSLPGIGPKTAEKIIDYRSRRPFLQIEDLMQVNSIGPRKFEAIKRYLVIR